MSEKTSVNEAIKEITLLGIIDMTNTDMGWREDSDDTSIYNDNNIEKIEENTDKVKYSFSSIPTMFARLDFINQAFASINKKCKKALDAAGDSEIDKQETIKSILNPDLKKQDEKERGNSVYNRVVSECFDIGMLFFCAESSAEFSQRMKIYNWSRDLLKNEKYEVNGDEKETPFSIAFKFFSQGYEQLKELKNIYIMEWDGAVVGGTSPMSLFWSSEEARKNNYPQVGEYKFFGIPTPLYKRDKQFKFFIYDVQKRLGRYFKTNLKNLNDYIDYCKIVDGDIDEYNNARAKAENDNKQAMPLELDVVSVARDENGNDKENLQKMPIGVTIGNKTIDFSWFKEDLSASVINSPLIIRASKGSNKPMVLPSYGNDKGEWRGIFIDSQGKSHISDKPYMNRNSQFPEGKSVPYEFAEDDINQRTLPGYSNIKYPCLTLNDFFEDYLVEAPYPINDEKFVALQLGERYFFPPIKERFFEYFDFNQEYRNEENFRIEESGSFLKVSLAIPVAGGKVVYEKNYSTGVKTVTAARGVIEELKQKENEFCFTFLPFVRPSETTPIYASLTTYFANKEGRFFIGETPETLVEEKVTETEITQGKLLSKHFVCEKEHDYFKLNFKKDENSSPIPILVVPKFSNQNAGGEYDFAVDIGTTTTYIAYRNKDGIKPFDDIFEDKDLLVNLYKGEDFRTSHIGRTIALEFLPWNEPGKQEFKLPVKTAFWQQEGIEKIEGQNKGINTELFSKGGFNFTLGNPKIEWPKTRFAPKELKTNYKWGTVNTENYLMYATIEEIMFLIERFVQLKGGKLRSVSASYPISMSIQNKLELKEKWKNMVENAGENVTFGWHTESEAPYYFFANKTDGTGQSLYRDGMFITLDIGGGSTDISICAAEGDITSLVTTSFNFAGDIIFGDPTGAKSSETNTFLMYNLKKSGKKADIEKLPIYSKFEPVSARINSYLFSLKDFDYARQLKEDKKFRMLVCYFYAAILYHVCDIFNLSSNPNLAENFKNSDNKGLLLSGNGSRIITSFIRMPEVFAKNCLEAFLDCKLDGESFGGGLLANVSTQTKVLFEHDDNPKQVTATGMLMMNTEAQTFADMPQQDIDAQIMAEVLGQEPIILYPGTETIDLSSDEAKGDNAAMSVEYLLQESEFKKCLAKVRDFHAKFIKLMKTGGYFRMNIADEVTLSNFEKLFGADVEANYQYFRQAYRQEFLKDTVDRTGKLNETTFFFPIKHVISDFFLNYSKELKELK